LDLAPAGFQSYFNPLLDSAYYFMSVNLPPKLVGFIMGFVPALIFTPLWLSVYFLIYRSNLFGPGARSISTVVAFAGVFSVSVVSQTGSVSGDTVTALFQIWALYFLLKHVVGVKEDSGRIALWLLFSGFISGLGVGLKLTGAPASLALFLGLFFIGRRGFARLTSPFVFSVGAVLGVAIFGGYWFFQMYQHFGNPLFPQFGSFFPSDLASSVSVIDKRFLPTGFLDFLIRPLEFLFNPGQFDGAAWPQIMWPLLYIFAIIFLFKKAKDFFYFSQPWRFDSGATFVILYTIFGFIAWMVIFSIYRYQVYFYLTAPVVALFFVRYIFSEELSKKIIILISFFSVLLALVFGIKSYKAEPWSNRYIQARPEDSFTIPASSTVMFVGQAIGWIAPFFPQSVSLVGIGNNFPVAEGYNARVKELISKNINTYAVFELPQDYRFSAINRANNFLTFLQVNHSARGCDAVKWILAHTRLHASFSDFPRSPDGVLCGLIVSQADEVRHAQEVSEAKLIAGRALMRYGYDLNNASCSVQHAYVGRRLFTFDLCHFPNQLGLNSAQ
jgi:hypothetical protein